MKKLIHLLLITCFLISGGGQVLAGDELEIKCYEWQGEINNKIPVTVWVEINEDLIVGEIVYLNTVDKKPIRLLGEVNPDYIHLQEMLPDGVISGMITGNIKDGAFIGHWMSPPKIVDEGDYNFKHIDGKEYPINLKERSVAHKAYGWDFKPNNLVGRYRYSYGPNNAGGIITLDTPGQDYVFIDYEISSATAAPAFNMADTGPQKGEITGKRLECHLEADCAYEMLFFNNFIAVRYLKDNPCQGVFGWNASLEGLFLKIK